MQYLENLITHMASVIPLSLFSFLGSALEEILAPIPSPLVLGAIGTLAYVDGYGFWALPILAIIAATGKVLGGLIVYFVSDKLENYIAPTFAKFFFVDHKQIESIGKKLKGGWRDYVTLSVLRAIPFIPSFVISIACGIIKVDLKLFILSTYIGSFVRGFIFIILGFGGYEFVTSLTNGFTAAENTIQILIAIFVFGLLVYLYKKRDKIIEGK